MDMLLTFFQQFTQAPITVWLWVLPLTLVIWFIPSILALFFNRKYLKLIVLANIPAGFSFIAWGACIVWAVTGKVTDNIQDKTIDKKIRE
ncbi:superinfection immunity protein [Cellvibrio sp. pealriver]|uniref:superinfection immunity protein n=1 Tax=Cellvibrio sp. pealriver TaxID=1622269 RepID=UPI0009E3CAAC|nr:superinfection immunity protein [Cellvibrio sp. pealriver]